MRSWPNLCVAMGYNLEFPMKWIMVFALLFPFLAAHATEPIPPKSEDEVVTQTNNNTCPPGAIVMDRSGANVPVKCSFGQFWQVSFPLTGESNKICGQCVYGSAEIPPENTGESGVN